MGDLQNEIREMYAQVGERSASEFSHLGPETQLRTDLEISRRDNERRREAIHLRNIALEAAICFSGPNGDWQAVVRAARDFHAFLTEV